MGSDSSISEDNILLSFFPLNFLSPGFFSFGLPSKTVSFFLLPDCSYFHLCFGLARRKKVREECETRNQEPEKKKKCNRRIVPTGERLLNSTRKL